MPYADPEQRRECNRRWMRQWRADKPGKARAALQRWRDKNPNYRRDHYRLDSNDRSKTLLLAAVRGVLVHRKSNRDWDIDAKLRPILGCTKATFRSHIEAQFTTGRPPLPHYANPLPVAGGLRFPARLGGHRPRAIEPGMTWQNYGRGGWEIDHIKPCRDFDLTDPDQITACFHFTNLRPLWPLDNQRRTRKE